MLSQKTQWLKYPPPLFLTAASKLSIPEKIADRLSFAAEVPSMTFRTLFYSFLSAKIKNIL
jgi:hypothetical protein